MNWYGPEPNGARHENCLGIIINPGSRKGWYDVTCGAPNYFVCEIDVISTPTTTVNDNCDADWNHFQGNCYKVFLNKKNFLEASNDCQSQGAKLAQIKSQETNKFVTGMKS